MTELVIANGTNPPIKYVTEHAGPVNPFTSWADRLGEAIEAYGQAPWRIGDLLNEGYERFGEKYTQGVPDNVLKYNPDSLRNFMWVCSRIAPAVRRITELSFGHHQVVAAMEPELQNRWLALSVERDWRIRDLKAAIKSLSPSQDAQNPPESPNDSSEGDNIETASEAILSASEAVLSYCRSKEGSRWTDLDTKVVFLALGGATTEG